MNKSSLIAAMAALLVAVPLASAGCGMPTAGEAARFGGMANT